MAPKSNIQSWRPDLNGKVHPAAVSAFNLLFDAIQDHDTAIVGVDDKVTALKAPASPTPTTPVPSPTTPTPAPPPPPAPSPFPNLGTVNVQTGAVYATQVTDNGGLLVVGNASPVAVLLTATVAVPWFMSVVNLGTSNAVFTPSAGTINNASNLTLRPNGGAFIYFDGISFWAPFMPNVPATKTAVAHQWLQSYDAATGLFTQTQPAYSDLSGPILFQVGGVNTGSQVKQNLIAGTNVTIVDGGTGNVTVSATGTGTSILLQTNSVTNGSQAKLNLVAGTNVTIADDGSGDITLSATGGGVASYTPRIKTANYTAVASDAVFCNTLGGGFTVTLPSAVTNAGKVIVTKKTSVDMNTLTVAGTGGDLLDGAATQLIFLPYASYEFVSDGVSNWWVI